MTELKLFGSLDSDLDAGRALAEIGMDQALSADRAQLWRIAADQWLEDQPSGTLVQADDLIAAIGLPDEGPNRNNSVGAWFSAKQKARQLSWTGRHVPSKRVVRHGNTQRLWRVR